jgi:hypothetical protein
MIRKVLFALTALTVLGTAAIVPTAASAKGGKGGGGYNHHHGGWGNSIYIGGPAYAYAGGCWTKRWVDTPFGPRLKRVYVCY